MADTTTAAAAETAPIPQAAPAEPDGGIDARLFGWMLVLLTVACTAYNWLTPVHHDVLEIALWSRAPWSAGFWKHPPMLPWIFKAGNLVAPFGPVFLAVLMALNITLGAWAAWRIARLVLDPRRAAIAFGLTLLLPFTVVMPLKLNHNAILVSLWPLTILAFLTALRQPTVISGIALGILAALAMLAKYYSGLLLLSIFIASIASFERRRFWTQPAPYVAFIAFMLVMTPHILWFVEQAGSPVRYAVSSEKGERIRALIFAVETMAMLLPAVIATFLLGRPWPGDAIGREYHHRRELMLLTVLPFALTIVLTLVLRLRGATAWAMPLFTVLPVLLAGALPQPAMTVVARVLPVVRAGAAIALAALMVSPLIGLAARNPATIEPRAELVAAIEARWRAATDKPIRVVAGDPRLTAAASWGMTDRPLGWPDYDAGRAPWITPWLDSGDLASSGAIAICRATDLACVTKGRELLGKATTARSVVEHAIEVRRDLGLVKGPLVAFTVLMALPKT